MKNKVFCAIIVGLVVLGSGCERKPYIVRSEGMLPQFEPGDSVDIATDAYALFPPRRWDVILFKAPAPHESDVWMFRIVGLPGEAVSFDEQGILINGKRKAIPSSLKGPVAYRLTPPTRQPNATEFPYKVPENSYFVLGDNPARAHDSRMWGGLSRKNIIGKVLK